MTTTFTTRAAESFASQVTNVPGKRYIVNGPLGRVTAKFLYAKDQDKIMHMGGGRRIRIAIVEKHWEIV